MQLADLRTTIRQRTDMESSQFITDSELDGWIRSSTKELYDLLIEVGEYDFAQYTFKSVPGQNNYALPDDFFHLEGAEVQAGSSDTDPYGWITLHKYRFGERNRRGPFALYRLWPKYRVLGSNFSLEPAPDDARTYRLAYRPRMPELMDSSTIQVLSSIVSGQQITINGVVFTADDSSPNSTAGDIVSLINAATNILTSALYGLTASAVTDTVTITSTRPYSVDITSASKSFYAKYSHWSNDVDDLGGWLEYVITDVSIKVMEKDESDPSVFFSQKQALTTRIKDNANRDPSEPETATDTEGLLGSDWRYWR